VTIACSFLRRSHLPITASARFMKQNVRDV
jgi:hypothetical protein